MSHVKGAGSVSMTKNMEGKRLGVKKFGGQTVRNGNIIVKQRGTVYHSGLNTRIGRDHTIYAIKDGVVAFRRMTGYKRDKYMVDVLTK